MHKSIRFFAPAVFLLFLTAPQILLAPPVREKDGALVFRKVMPEAGTATGLFIVFGPENFQPTGGSKKATIFNRTFSVNDPSGSYTLRIFNGGANGQFGRVSSCGIVLNGATVVRPSDVNQGVAGLMKTVTVKASNTLQIQVAGNAGSGVTVQIDGQDTTAPTITAVRSPGPNANGWNNTNVTVSFTCTDARSGIATCSSPVTVSAEGANQVVTGTATDKAGNTATTSVTLNIDKTAPTLTATRSPGPNGNGWNNSNVTVSFTCSDALSGVGTCPPPDTVTTDGAGQVRSGMATDRAGNMATASTTVNLDKTPPIVTGSASPAPNGAGWNRTDVTVSFTCSDATSGCRPAPDRRRGRPRGPARRCREAPPTAPGTWRQPP